MINPPSGNLFTRVWWRLVRFGFRLLYNEMAFTYDAVSWLVSLGEWRTWQRAALKHLDAVPGDVILEVAHGTGNLQRDLRDAGYRPVGIDLSRAMGRIAAHKLRREGAAPALAQASAEALPFAAGSFAVAVCTFPTEFILRPDTLSALHRVLKPGGRLVFVPNAVLTRGGPARQGLELAYRVTGQRAGFLPGVAERFAGAGFTLRAVGEPCKRSIAQVYIAEKRA